MKVKTSELVGVMLDYAVALCEGGTDFRYDTLASYWITINGKDRTLSRGWAQSFTPSTNWQQGGPIIEHNRISIIRCGDTYEKGKKGYCTNKRIPVWAAEYGGGHSAGEIYGSEGDYWGDYYSLDESDCASGPTPLIAAMRCYVASKMGNEIEIPEELVN